MRAAVVLRLCGIALAAGLLLPAAAGARFDEGVAAYERGDYAAALKIFRPLAAAGDARAQFALGVMYAQGRGVPKDERQAVHWYRKAAEQGNAGAQAVLGAMYAQGRGVPKGEQQAYFWWLLAAARGHADAAEARDWRPGR